MNRRNQLNQRLPHPSSSTPSPILQPPSGPSSGRVSPAPYPRPGSSASQYSESPYGGGMASSSGNGSGYTRNAMAVEGQNDELLEGLLGKVKILKDITVGIGNEVRDSNMELGGMNDAFSSTSTFLNGTYRRMTRMAKRQGGTWCYFTLFVMFVLWLFIVVWWLRR